MVDVRRALGKPANSHIFWQIGVKRDRGPDLHQALQMERV